MADPNLFRFYLTGGTALAAYYLKHRVSDDLDFFTYEEPERMYLHGFAESLKDKLGADKLRFERLYDRNQFFFLFGAEELKVEFTKYPFATLEEPRVIEEVRVDSLRDIAANKLMALVDRFEPKDFIDLYFLLQEFPLSAVRSDVENKFGHTLGPVFLGGEFAKAKHIAALPKMLKPLTVEELKAFFAQRARELAPEIFK